MNALVHIPTRLDSKYKLICVGFTTPRGISVLGKICYGPEAQNLSRSEIMDCIRHTRVGSVIVEYQDTLAELEGPNYNDPNSCKAVEKHLNFIIDKFCNPAPMDKEFVRERYNPDYPLHFACLHVDDESYNISAIPVIK